MNSDVILGAGVFVHRCDDLLASLRPLSGSEMLCIVVVNVCDLFEVGSVLDLEKLQNMLGIHPCSSVYISG